MLLKVGDIVTVGLSSRHPPVELQVKKVEFDKTISDPNYDVTLDKYNITMNNGIIYSYNEWSDKKHKYNPHIGYGYTHYPLLKVNDVYVWKKDLFER